MNGSIVLALPSKGRLQEQTEELFRTAGLTIERGARNYRGRIAGNLEVEVAYLSASEIARELAAGTAHLGVTGLDLVNENVPEWERRIELVSRLGFGAADVVVAVPDAWIDVWTMEDLDDVAAGFLARHGRRLRVATKYWNLTQRFFASHGIALYRVVESVGATEGAPAAGTADAIVDITTTGSTLAANGLKVLDDGLILRSEAHLALSKRANWSAPQSAILRSLLGALAESGVDLARESSPL